MKIYIKKPLCRIFNATLSTDSFPDLLKYSLVVPLFKPENLKHFQIIGQYLFFCIYQKLMKTDA